MSKEELYKALKTFNREDLTYENDAFFNNFEEYMNTMKQEKAIEVFMSIEDMIRYSKLEQEIERLNNIINELEKYINETKLEEFEKEYGRRYGKTFTLAEVIICNMILNKLQELKKK